MHSEIAPENQLYTKFQMLSEVKSISNEAPWFEYWETAQRDGVKFTAFNTVVDEYIADGQSLCPDGWRIPNQLEMAVAYYYGNETGYTFCRTYFSFGPYGSKKETEKIGYKLRDNINVSDTECLNTYRCVRDVRVD